MVAGNRVFTNCRAAYFSGQVPLPTRATECRVSENSPDGGLKINHIYPANLLKGEKEGTIFYENF